MMGMGFLRLNKILRRHRWTRSGHEEEVERFHTREDRVMNGCLVAFFIALVLAIVVSQFK